MRERTSEGETLGENECAIILHSAKESMISCGDLEKDLRVAWDMVIRKDICFLRYPDEDCQFRLGIGVVLMLMDDGDDRLDKLRRSLRGLQALHSYLDGKPVLPSELDDSDIYPLMQYWIDYKQT